MVALPIILAACAIGSVSAQCGTLGVPENRAEPGGRQIELAVAVVPAVDRAHRRPDPVFWISGGPGGVAREDLNWVVPAFANTVLQEQDLVFVDRRGVGSSHPLSCAVAQSSEDPAELVRACLGVVQGTSRTTARPMRWTTSTTCAPRSATTGSTCGAAPTAPPPHRSSCVGIR